MISKRAGYFLLLLSIGLFSGEAALARCKDFVPGPKPQNVGRDIVGKDLDAIVERGFIEFAVYEDFPPYSYRHDGRQRGIDIEIGRMIAEDLGVEPRFNYVAAGENLETDLRNYVWKGPLINGRVSNVMLHVPYDSEYACRVEQVVFTGQYFDEAIAIAYRKDDYGDEPPVPAYFRYDTVGVENDSIADFYLTSLFGGQLGKNIRRYKSAEEAMSALSSGEIMAVMGPRGQVESGLDGNLGIHQPPLPGFAVSHWTIGVAVNFRYRPLAYAVDDAIRNGLESGRVEEIFKRHGLTFVAPER